MFIHHQSKLFLFRVIRWFKSCMIYFCVGGTTFPSQELALGNFCQCGTICVDSSGSDLLTRVGNEVYEMARAALIDVPSFPDFTPHIQGLKAGAPTERSQPLRVTAVRGDKLMILESLAKRWLDTESTQSRANDILVQHNKEFNPDGDTMLSDRSGFMGVMLFAVEVVSLSSGFASSLDFFCCHCCFHADVFNLILS